MTVLVSLRSTFHSSVQQLPKEQQIAERQVSARLSGSHPLLLPLETEAKPSSHQGRHAPTETRRDAATLLLTQLTNKRAGTRCTGHMGVIHVLSQAEETRPHPEDADRDDN